MNQVAAHFQDASPAERRRAVALFKVLSHPERLRLVCYLGDGCVTTQKALVEEFDWPQSTAARHIAALRIAGIVAAERDGTEIRLSMATPVALQLLETVCDWVRQAQEEEGHLPFSVDSFA